jgi:hypothetical protein
MDRPTQGGDFDYLQSSPPTLLQQPTFRTLGWACDQDHLVVELLLQIQTVVQGVFLGAANNHARDQMSDAHRWVL